ncbi:hypothetical protein HZ994_01340 [Akkermansiaceae bacterium]|nr:hypothetical protein HZ994_01340 [Akkermansiaceae bacterium]
MKGFLVASGLFIALAGFVIVLESRDNGAVSIGFSMVASACLISAALWAAPRKEKDYGHFALLIYSALAREPLAIATLVEDITGGCYGDEAKAIGKSVVVAMLDERKIIIADGLVRLPAP